MKVALITPDLPHYRENLYKIFAADDSIHFVHYSDMRERYGVASVPVSSLEAFQPATVVSLGPLRWQKGVVKAALNKSFDKYVMTGDFRFISTWVASVIVRLRRKPLFFWTMGWRRPETGVKKYIRNTFYSIPHKLMVYGNIGKKLGVHQGFPESRIEVVFNSVSDFREIERSGDSCEGKINAVGVVGRLNKVKKLPLLLDAVNVLKDRGLNLEIIFAGEGSDRDALEAKAAKLNINCKFLGAIYDPEEIANFYKKIKVTVVPAAIGLTAIQSLAHGVPVITDDKDSDHGPEVDCVIDGITGSKYPAGDINALADEIEKWIAQATQHPNETSRNCVEEFKNHWTPEVQAHRMLTVIQSQ